MIMSFQLTLEVWWECKSYYLGALNLFAEISGHYIERSIFEKLTGISDFFVAMI